jgi:antitoxin MazE
MEVTLIDIGNSKGIRLPKAVLKQVNFSTTATLEVVDNKLVLIPIKRKPREGWAENIRSIKQAMTKPDELSELVNINNEFDKNWEW